MADESGRWQTACAGTQSGPELGDRCQGALADDAGLVLVEARAYKTSRLGAGALGEFVDRIIDAGAVGGIIISPLPLQEGRARVAFAEGNAFVQLQAADVPDSYFARFLKNIMIRPPPDSLSVNVRILSGSADTVDLR